MEDGAHSQSEELGCFITQFAGSGLSGGDHLQDRDLAGL